MPTLNDAVAAKGMDRDSLARAAEVSPVDVGKWLHSNQVPDEHRETLERILECSLDAPAPKPDKPSNGSGSGGSKPQKKAGSKSTGRKRSPRKRSGVNADVSHALGTCAALAFAQDGQRQVVARLLDLDHNLDSSERLVEAAEGLLTLNKSTSDALEALPELTQLEKELQVGIQLAKKDKRELSELFRVTGLLLGQGVDGDATEEIVTERVTAVKAEAMDMLKWLTKMVG